MSFHYLASPYTDPEPEVMRARYLEAMRCMKWLLERRIWVYSPIVHCHALAVSNDLPRDNEYWKTYNREMLEKADGLLVLKIDGYETSAGIQDEMEVAAAIDMKIAVLVPHEDRYIIEVNRRSL